MRNKSKYLALAAVTMLTACSQPSGENENVTVIPVNVEKSEKLAMSDVFSRIEVIELEGKEGSFLSSYRTLEMGEGNYYLSCVTSSEGNVVIAFDAQGKFLFNTDSRRGRGHNEYNFFNSFYVRDGNLTLSNFDGNVITYDSQLNAIDSYSAHNDGYGSYSETVPLSDDIVAVYASSMEESVWLLYSKSGKEIIGCSAPMEDNTMTLLHGLNPSSVDRAISNDSITLVRPCSMMGYTLYKLSADDLSLPAVFRYDVGADAFKESDMVAPNEIQKKLPDYVTLLDCKMNNNFILARLGHHTMKFSTEFTDARMCWSMYSLKTGEQRLIDNLFQGDKLVYSMDALDDSAIYSVVASTRWFNNIDHLYEDSLLDDASRAIINSRTDETNGLIFKYYFKEDL